MAYCTLPITLIKLYYTEKHGICIASVSEVALHRPIWQGDIKMTHFGAEDTLYSCSIKAILYIGCIGRLRQIKVCQHRMWVINSYLVFRAQQDFHSSSNPLTHSYEDNFNWQSRAKEPTRADPS